MERFIKNGFKKSEIESSLKKLIRWKLIIDRDGRFLSLALREPVRIIRDDEKNPLIGFKKKFKI